MQVVRDQDKNGKGRRSKKMLAKMKEASVTRCNLKGCKTKPNTIVEIKPQFHVGMCEEHYQQVKDKPKTQITLEF